MADKVDVINQTLDSLDARITDAQDNIKAITELLAKMHVDLYMHIDNLKSPKDE